ncbi:hypothetical protein Tco_1485404 [Tanacetum coccineum]
MIISLPCLIDNKELTSPEQTALGKDFSNPLIVDSECLIEGPELIEITNEKVAVAKEKLKEARSRQKSYADKHRHDLEFQVGDRVFLKVSPFRGVKRFGIKGKLSPRFIRFKTDMSLSRTLNPFLDPQERVMRNKVNSFCKFLWIESPRAEVLAKVGKVAYKLELPQELSRVHHTFHVSNLKKCYADKPLVMPLEGIHVDDKL